MDDTAPSSSTTKEKKTRRRQRVSCVECTKRRQRCDRQHPCGLCVSRGVAHLCHWASGPVPRPTPARPPMLPDQGNPAELSVTIRTLSERLATLERTISSKDSPPPTTTFSSERYPSSDSSSRPQSISLAAPSLWPTDLDKEEESPPAPLQREVHEAAVTLAQLSLAHHGEYLGSGTVLCALHKLGKPANIFVPYSKSTESTSTNDQTIRPFTLNPVQVLAARGLPPRQETDALIARFFAESNWRFGIPEKWFRGACSSMWRALDACGAFVGPGAEQINANWLSLLFAVLALVPSATDDISTGASTISSETCFFHALSARRLAEDAFLTSPSFSPGQSAAEGTVLGCLATVLTSTYLADRGRFSEAWKLVGAAMRAGQAAGMHLDPSWDKWQHWQVMCEEERVLRSRGWRSLVIWDQLLSSLLGRPPMIPSASMVNVLPPMPKRSDGSEDLYDAFHMVLVELSQIVGEAAGTCDSHSAPPYAAALEMDRRYEKWLTQLPAEFRWWSPPPPIAAAQAELERTRILQRHTIAMWYLASRMNLHRPWITRATPPVLPPPLSLPGSQSIVLNPSREKCITLALELVQRAMQTGEGTGTFFVFDGAVTLISALAYAPDHTSAGQCREMVERAMEILHEADEVEGQGEIAHRAIEVLNVLRRAGGWTEPRDDVRGQPWTDGHEPEARRNAPNSASELSQALGTTVSQPSSHPVSNTRTQPPANPNPLIPFLAPESFSVGGWSSSPSAGLWQGAARNEALANPSDGGGVWTGVGGLNPGNNNGTVGMDVHMMLPFTMLEAMPQDQYGSGT